MKRHIFIVVLAILGLSINGYASKIITIQGTEYTVDTLRHVKVGPGTMYTSLLYKSTNKKFRGFFLSMDMKGNDNVQFKMELGNDTTLTTEQISHVAQRKSKPNNYYLAGVNADFYITSSYDARYTGTPHMDCIMEGEVASSGYLPAIDYGHFFMDYNKNMWCASPNQNYSITFPDSRKANLARVNLDIYDNELVLFNSKYGVNTHTTGATEVALKLVPGEKWKVNGDVKLQVVGSPVSKGKMAIPADGAVLSSTGSMTDYVSSLKEGDVITARMNFELKEYGVSPDIKMCSGGDVILLYHGEVTYEAPRYINGRDNNNPRTMLGYSQDGSKMVWGLIDGRSSISDGCTYPEGAEVMREAGCYDALNVDGGGSSGMYIQNLGIMNKPSDGTERSVSNGIYAVLNAPEDNEIAEIKFVDYAMKFPKYGIYTPQFYGYNKYGMLIDTDVKGVKLSCSPELGTIKDDNTFFGDGIGTHALTATLGNITSSIPVTVVEAENVSFKLNKVIVDGFKDYKIEVNALVNEELMAIDPTALTWKTDDASTVTVNSKGILAGVKDGTTNVHGNVGSFDGTLEVVVEKPTAHVMPIDPNLDPTSWTLTQTGGSGIIMTPFENGMKLNYTGASGRNPNIKLAKLLQVWSLPDAIQLRINPGDASIKNLTISTKAGNGTTVNNQIPLTLIANQDNVVTLLSKDWFDTEDFASYPVFIYNITFGMNASTVGKSYEIAIPGIEAVYDVIPASVDNIKTDPNKFTIYPNPVNRGECVNIAGVSQNKMVRIFNMAGQLIKEIKLESTNNIILSTSDLLSGIYLISIDNNINKLIIK